MKSKNAEFTIYCSKCGVLTELHATPASEVADKGECTSPRVVRTSLRAAESPTVFAARLGLMDNPRGVLCGHVTWDQILTKAVSHYWAVRTGRAIATTVEQEAA